MGEKLAVLVTTYNEEKNIARCLKSVEGLWGELIVVDSFSTDKTVEIAKTFGAKVLQREYVYPAEQKNWALERINNLWVLILDADECLTPKLEAEIKKILQSPTYDGYWIRRETFFCGQRVRAWSGDTVIRLFRRDRGKYEDKLVHEEIQMKGTLGKLSAPMEHYTFRSFAQYLPRIDRYTTWGAQEAYKRGRRSNFLKIVFHPAGHFAKNYFLKLGFLDGVPGILVAMLSAYSTYLKYAKLWEIQQNSRNDN